MTLACTQKDRRVNLFLTFSDVNDYVMEANEKGMKSKFYLISVCFRKYLQIIEFTWMGWGYNENAKCPKRTNERELRNTVQEKKYSL